MSSNRSLPVSPPFSPLSPPAALGSSAKKHMGRPAVELDCVKVMDIFELHAFNRALTLAGMEDLVGQGHFGPMQSKERKAYLNKVAYIRKMSTKQFNAHVAEFIASNEEAISKRKCLFPTSSKVRSRRGTYTLYRVLSHGST